MNDKTNVLTVYQVTTVRLVISLVTDCVQLGTTVQTKLQVLIIIPVQLEHTLKNKEHKVII